MAVRAAQQRAELLVLRRAEAAAQLEEAQREKQRMATEVQGMAKQVGAAVGAAGTLEILGEPWGKLGESGKKLEFGGV